MTLKKLHTWNWIFWLILFCLFSVYARVEQDRSENLVHYPGAQLVTLAILSQIVLYLYPWLTKKPLPLLRHSIAAVIFGFLYQWLTGISILLGERLFGFTEHYTLASLLDFFIAHPFRAFEGAVLYAVIMITISFFHFKHLYDLRKKELRASQNLLESSSLKTLTNQLQPHFLFNAMNNISMLIRKNENSKAIDMTAKLSSLLRRSMSGDKQKYSSVAEEISFLNDYIALETLRYEHVHAELKVDDQILEARIPQMTLQPLVENAFKYGNTDSGTVSVTVHIYRDDKRLAIEVFNPGTFDASWNISDTRGIGLHNTIHRLRQIYGANYTFRIQEEQDGVRIIIRIPYEG